MWLAIFRSPLHVFIGADQIGVKDGEATVWTSTSGLEDSRRILQSYLNSFSGRRLRVWLGAEYCYPFSLDRSSGARGVQERAMLGSMLVRDAGWLEGDFTLWLSNRPSYGLFAAAASNEVLALITELAEDQGCHVVSIAPVWDSLLEQFAKSVRISHTLMSLISILISRRESRSSSILGSSAQINRVMSIAECHSVTVVSIGSGKIDFIERAVAAEDDPMAEAAVKRVLAARGVSFLDAERYAWVDEKAGAGTLNVSSVRAPIGSFLRLSGC